MKKKSLRETVIRYYPDAVAINSKGVRTKEDYFEIWSSGSMLGKGKSKKGAWSAAAKNINS